MLDTRHLGSLLQPHAPPQRYAVSTYFQFLLGKLLAPCTHMYIDHCTSFNPLFSTPFLLQTSTSRPMVPELSHLLSNPAWPPSPAAALSVTP